MKETVEQLYMDGKLTEKGLDNAVKRKWITAAEKIEIMEKKKAKSCTGATADSKGVKQ